MKRTGIGFPYGCPVGYGGPGVDMGNAIEIAGRLPGNSIVDSPGSPGTGIKVGNARDAGRGGGLCVLHSENGGDNIYFFINNGTQ